MKTFLHPKAARFASDGAKALEKKDEWVTFSVVLREGPSDPMEETSPDLLGFSASKKAGTVA